MAIQQPNLNASTSNDMSQPINISLSKNNSLYHNPRLRRESIAHSQGMGGISWGSVGIGSWLRDEVFILQNNNNNNNNNINTNQNQNFNQFRQPSINLYNGNFNNNNAMDLRNDSINMNDSSLPNSSYLADLEANYCKDYSCCGQLLPNLHDLLKHYEEMHIENDLSNLQNLANNPHLSNLSNNLNSHIHNNNIANNLNKNNSSIGAVSTNEVFLNNHLNTKQNSSNNNKKFNLKSNTKIPSFNLNLNYGNSSNTNLQNNNTNDGSSGGSKNNLSNNISNISAAINSRSATNTTNNGDNNGNTSNTHLNNLQHNELHQSFSNFNFDQANMNSQPMQFDFTNNQASTIFQNDGLVKDLENQAKMFQQQVQEQEQHLHANHFNTSNSDINNHHHSNLTHNNNHNNTNTNNIGGNNNHNINNPLSMPAGNSRNNQSKNTLTANNTNMDMDIDHDTQFQMEVDDDNNRDDEIEQEICIDDPARRLYVMEQSEDRPFQCPVIGCDKTYKNQNGLKYHRIHGHQNQKLRENPDGTFSVINPESDSPYPHGMAFEKDKPYRCEVCGKRYKNLNGLKYHRGHTTH